MTAEELGRKVSERVDEFGDWMVRRADLEALGLRHNSLALHQWMRQYRLRTCPRAAVEWVYFARMPEAPKFPRLSYAPRLPGEPLQ